MRGESKQTTMLMLRSPESMVPSEHQIPAVKALCDAALKTLSGQLDRMYVSGGRASIPPEWLLKGSMLMALYSVRSERMSCEQLGYSFVHLNSAEQRTTEQGPSACYRVAGAELRGRL